MDAGEVSEPVLELCNFCVAQAFNANVLIVLRHGAWENVASPAPREHLVSSSDNKSIKAERTDQNAKSTREESCHTNVTEETAQNDT